MIGHSKKAPGARFALGGNEYHYNSKVADIAKRYADSKYGKNVTTHLIFRDGIGRSGAYKKAEQLQCDVVVELHFNAFNKTVVGTETLTTTHSGDKAYGKAMQDMMVKVFDRTGQSRGLKPISRSTRGGANVYGLPNGYNCLVEPFFGDVRSEAEMALDKQEEYAKGLINTSVKFCREHLGILK
jgi:N-acetylmuramoyl-L-alanine amidase